MARRRFAASVVAVGLLATSAHADDIYFHRANANWAEYEADVSSCLARTAHTQGSIGSGGAAAASAAAGSVLMAGLLAGVVTAIQEAAERPKQRRRNVSYCMALRGWTTVQIEDLGNAGSDSDGNSPLLDQRLQAWFAEPTPPVGEMILRPESIARTEAELPAPINLETALAEEAARRRRN
jgi:hypothetical protein